jgi:putative heme iron utilization protein
MSTRTVVHVTGENPEPVDHVTDHLQAQGIDILDKQPHMLLVAADTDTVKRALEPVRGWGVSGVTTVPHPRTRPRVLRKP